MSASIKEALRDVAEFYTLPFSSNLVLRRKLDVIREALEAAAQEAEDRKAVEAWLDADDARYESSGRQYTSGYYFTLYRDQMRADREPFYGTTREEALSRAAAWCRAELAK